MKQVVTILSFAVSLLLFIVGCKGGEKVVPEWELLPPEGCVVDTVCIDTMDVRNPYIRYDYSSDMYYMVADGGYMWRSKDLTLWNGPYDILRWDTASWIGKNPVVTSPEIHKCGNRYYYMATFEPESVSAVKKSSVALVADSITGPYRTIDAGAVLLDAKEVAVHPTFCTDYLDAAYMIYCHDGEQNGDAAVQIIRFSENFARRVGEAYIMFTASQVPWSGSVVNGERNFSPIVEAPCLFYCGDDVMGMLFTSRVGDEKRVGTVYSETGTLNGPWVVDEAPLLAENVGSAMLFNDYDGTLVMAVTMDTVVNGVAKSVPRLIKCDSQFDKLQTKGNYKF
ncbi:MAG: family 43 glycosylhydrolase [Bacteroidaceae bacterium]|nr:family 43 glycosylhydrolase [Bacteroidaceae bacterium]